MYEAFISILFIDGTGTTLSPGIVFPTWQACIANLLSEGAFAMINVASSQETKEIVMMCTPAGDPV